jgi:predicted DsbA family dithiol-disulfide isomerase
MNTLHFYFDYACPWCYVGAKTVRELAAEGVEISYHVWKMPENATPPPKPEGYFEAATARLKQLREEAGLRLSSPVQKETIPALIATKVASEMGAAKAFVEAVFHAHWADKQDISDRSVLVSLAEKVGLDANKFQAALEEGTGQAAFEQDLATAAELNIDTIPSYLNGEKRLLIHHFDDVPTLETLRELAR